MFIGVSGLIGSGKSSLVKVLSEELKFEPIYEPVDTNEYLSDFYTFLSDEDIRKDKLSQLPRDVQWQYKSSIPAMMQIHLLAKRYALHQRSLFVNSVADRTIYEDTIFAKMLFDSGHIDARDFETYSNLFQVMKHSLMYPNVLIYLYVTPKTAFNRIKARSRSCESGISLEYLTSLYSYYETFIQEIKQFVPVEVVDWNVDADPDSEEYHKMVKNLAYSVIRKGEASNFFRTTIKI